MQKKKTKYFSPAISDFASSMEQTGTKKNSPFVENQCSSEYSE